jgi:hypothetical protein
VVWSIPSALDAVSTVTVTDGSTVPAAIGARVEVQVSTVSPTLSEQLQPVAFGAAANVSPDGRVAARVGPLYAGPPEAPRDELRVRV